MSKPQEKHFKKIRIEHKLTQNELVDKLSKYLSVGQSRISNIETGENERSIDLDLLDAYMETFGVTSDYLLGYTDDPSGKAAPDSFMCADYLGLPRNTVEAIKNMSVKDKFMVSLIYRSDIRFGFFWIFKMIRQYMIYKRSAEKTPDKKRIYKVFMYDLVDDLGKVIESMDYQELLEFTREFDKSNNTHIEEDLFDDVPGI